MEEISVYLNEQLVIGQVYFLKQSYYPHRLMGQSYNQALYAMNSLLNTIVNSDVFKNTWNTNNGHRFEIMTVVKEDTFVIIKGMSKNAESFNELNIGYTHSLIELINNIKAWYMGEAEPEQTAESILEEEETKKAFQKITTVIIVIVVLITLWFITPKIWKAIKKRK